MQKMITITIDTRMLAGRAHDAFTMEEVAAVNELLENGWQLEEWEFLTEDADEDGRISLIAVLNDDGLLLHGTDFITEDYDAESPADEQAEASGGYGPEATK